MIKNSCDGAIITQGDDVALAAQRAATSASSTRRFRFPFSPSQNCGYVLTNRYSRLFAISIEDLLVGIRIKLQYTPEKRRYSNFDLLVTLNNKNITSPEVQHYFASNRSRAAHVDASIDTHSRARCASVRYHRIRAPKQERAAVFNVEFARRFVR